MWAFTNLEEVVYLFKPNREGDFLHELLQPFRGVLVTDFYSAYDSLDCPQQKCLVHLIRDLNDDLLANPFDSELRELTATFGTLLRSIVATIDEHGLKRWRLRKHRQDVARFFRLVESLPVRSDVTRAVQQRLLKYRTKLFTFLDYNGVPWNNNNAENAIKRFAYYRRHVSGMMTANGIVDYLTLLSLYQTCRCKGLNFWKFLVSRNQDIDDFARHKKHRRGVLPLETYHDGYVTPFERMKLGN